MSFSSHKFSALGVSAFLLSSAGCALAKQENCSSNPFADPKNDPCNPLRYIPSNVLSGIVFGLFVTVGICHIISTAKWGARWMSALTIGMFTFATGIGFRFGLHLHPQSTGLYIAEDLFIVLSPCAFIAANYVLLGRLSRNLGMGKHLWIAPQKLTRLFITSDVITFLIQAAGGSIATSDNGKHLKLGSNIFLAGLAVQLASFLIFTMMYLRFIFLVHRNEPQVWYRDASLKLAWFNDWRALAAALLVSCCGILIRSVFRVVELTQGFEGSIATNEALFYALDSLPLFIAVAIYVPFWPGRFIRPETQVDVGDQVNIGDDKSGITEIRISSV